MKNLSLFLLTLNFFFSPFVYDTSEQWSVAFLGVSITVALLLYVFGACIKRYEFIEVIAWGPLFLLALFPLFQLVPLPPILIEAISPATYQLYEPLLGIRESGQWISLSIAPKATLQEFFRFSSYAFTYILTVQLLSRPPLLKKCVKFIVLFGACLSLWVIIKTIWLGSENSGRFVSLFLLMSPVAFALFFYYKPVVQKDVGLQVNIKLLFSEPSFHRHLFFGFSGVLMAVAILGSVCSGGVQSLLLTCVIFLVLSVLKLSCNKKWIFVLIVVVGAIFLWVGWDSWWGLSRIWDNSCYLMNGRIDGLEKCIEIAKLFPLFGTGLGSFEEIYPYLSLTGSGLVSGHVQSDILELLVEIGIIGTSLAVCFLIIVICHAWKKIYASHDRFIVLLGIGSLSGILVFIAHLFGSLHFYSGLSGFYVSFFLGALVAIVNSRFDYYETGTSLRTVSSAPRVVLVVFIFALLVASLMFHGGAWYSRYLYNTVKFVSTSADLFAIQYEVEKKAMLQAMRFDPFESTYPFRLAQLESFFTTEREAMPYLLKAGFKDVTKGEVYQHIGMIKRGTVDEKTHFIEIGYRMAPKNEQLAQTLVQWFFTQNRRDDALDVIAERLKHNYREMDGWAPLLMEHNVSKKELREFLPPSVDAWLYFGRYSEANLNRDDSDFYYEGALALISKDTIIDPEWFIRIISYYKMNNKPEMAVLCIRRAVSLVPWVGVFHRMLGDYYLKEGVTYRAKEEYERALFLDPEDLVAKRQLSQLARISHQ